MDTRFESVRMQIRQLLHAECRHWGEDGLRLQIVEVPCSCGLSDATLVASDQHGPVAAVCHPHECTGGPDSGPPSLAELDQSDAEQMARENLREELRARAIQGDEALPHFIGGREVHPELGGVHDGYGCWTGSGHIHGSCPRQDRGS